MARKLLKAGKVAQMVGVTTKTLSRWAVSLESDFPKPITRNGRHYWDEAAVRRHIDADFAARDKTINEARATVG